MVGTCFLVKIKCNSYGHCSPIRILSLKNHKISVKTNLTLTTPCPRSYAYLSLLSSEVGHFLSIHALHIGKSMGQAFLSRHFSFDLMICTGHRLQCVHSVWLMPNLALAKSDDIFSYYSLHADKEFKYKWIQHRTVYSKVLSPTL